MAESSSSSSSFPSSSSSTACPAPIDDGSKRIRKRAAPVNDDDDDAAAAVATDPVIPVATSNYFIGGALRNGHFSVPGGVCPAPARPRCISTYTRGHPPSGRPPGVESPSSGVCRGASVGHDVGKQAHTGELRPQQLSDHAVVPALQAAALETKDIDHKDDAGKKRRKKKMGKKAKKAAKKAQKRLAKKQRAAAGSGGREDLRDRSGPGRTDHRAAVVDGKGEEIADDLKPGDMQFTPLHDAVDVGNLLRVHTLLGAGANIEERDELVEATNLWDPSTPLYHAAVKGHVALVQYLVGRGANKEATTKCGKTALHAAAKHGHLEVVRMLIEHGANRDALDVNHLTAFSYACSHGQVTVAKYLLEQGSNVDHVSRAGSTALHAAAGIGSLAVAQLLFCWGAKLDVRTIRGREIAYGIACRRGHRHVADAIRAEELRRRANNSYTHNILTMISRGR